MAIRDTPADEALQQISRHAYRFLTGDKPAVYLAILVELYRAQQQHLQLELPFDALLDAPRRLYQHHDLEQGSEATPLRKDLNAESHGRLDRLGLPELEGVEYDFEFKTWVEVGGRRV